MGTENKPVTAYLKPDIDKLFKSYKTNNNIKNNSEALNKILASFFGLDNSVPAPLFFSIEEIKKLVREEINDINKRLKSLENKDLNSISLSILLSEILKSNSLNIVNSEIPKDIECDIPSEALSKALDNDNSILPSEVLSASPKKYTAQGSGQLSLIPIERETGNEGTGNAVIEGDASGGEDKVVSGEPDEPAPKLSPQGTKDEDEDKDVHTEDEDEDEGENTTESVAIGDADSSIGTYEAACQIIKDFPDKGKRGSIGELEGLLNGKYYTVSGKSTKWYAETIKIAAKSIKVDLKVNKKAP